MNNFIFQNATKVYFGQGCVKEYLACLTRDCKTVLLAYGGSSIKRNGVYDEVTGILRAAGGRMRNWRWPASTRWPGLSGRSDCRRRFRNWA